MEETQRNEVRLFRAFDVPASARAMWPLVADSSRLGKAMGLDPMKFQNTRTASGRVQHQATSTFLGKEVHWDEHPAQWVEGQQYAILRVFQDGPIEETFHTVSVTPTGDNTCRVAFDWRGRFKSTPVRLLFTTVMGGRWASAWEKQFTAMARFATGQAREVDQDVAYPVRQEVVVAAMPMRTALQKRVPEHVVDALVDHLASRPDEELMRIRPYVLAAKLGLTRMGALKTCLYATRAGLLSMRWDLLCPHCQGPKDTADTLGDVKGVGACDSCGIQFDAQFDRNVEVTFAPSTAVRKVEVQQFCFGGPLLTPHIRVQQELHAGETRAVQAGLGPGRYRVRAQGVPGTAMLDLEDGALPGSQADVSVKVDPAGVTVEPHTVRAQTVRFSLANETLETTPVMVETSQWVDTAATAATVTSLMEFRDLFSSELLAPGQGLQVGQVTLMFTDLKGSTRMYEQIGDVKAFTLVRDHFKLLEDVIRETDGGIVKTIGDAVMAVFDNPRRALAAAVRIQERAKNLKQVDGHPTIIKIGIHTGPCIAVQQNDKIDYFGNMVNVAARTQNESVGWDIVLTQAMLQDPDTAALAANIPSEPLVTELKGIAGPVTLKRLWPVGKPPQS